MSDRMPSPVVRTFASSSARKAASRPRFKCRAMSRLLLLKSLDRDDRQEGGVFAPSTDVDTRLSVEAVHRAIAWIVVQERSAARELVLHVGEPAAAAAGI